MCGIVGYVGYQPSQSIILDGLRRLEYRGYDSAGIGVVADEQVVIRKSPGKVYELESRLSSLPKSCIGIGHTRWATNGEVNERNAHPHCDADNTIAIVHNGIIDNQLTIRKQLQQHGCSFQSETDSELIAILIAQFYRGDFAHAVANATQLLRGTYGLVAMHCAHPQTLVGVRNGSPLVLGIGEGEMFFGSDVTAFLGMTKRVIYLEDQEMMTINPKKFHTTHLADGYEIDKKIVTIAWELEQIDKGDFQTFMKKEIFEQPHSILRAMQGRIDHENKTARLDGMTMDRTQLSQIQRVKIFASGTSYNAGMVGALLIELLARIPASAEISSELRSRNPVVEADTLYIAISQSGETADTLFAVRELLLRGAKVVGICNVVGSSIARETHAGVYTHSGPEIAVASTKAFTSQLVVLYLLTLFIGRAHHLSEEQAEEIITTLEHLPNAVERILALDDTIMHIAEKYAHCQDMLFLGRGIHYPIALEGALKMKEISYIHAEGFSSAEIKHGPIALINEEVPSVFIISDDHLYDKIIANIREVKARQGQVIAIAPENDHTVPTLADDIIALPSANHYTNPFLTTVALQLLAYHCARIRKCDVDQPRNLAKSVTVE